MTRPPYPHARERGNARSLPELRRRRAYVIGTDFTYNHRERRIAVETERGLSCMQIVGAFSFRLRFFSRTLDEAFST